LRAKTKGEKMKKILLFTVLLVFMWPRMAVGQEQTTQLQEQMTQLKELLSSEEQIRDLSNSILTFDNVIEDIDSIIDIYQQQRITLIEQRTKLNALKDFVMSFPSNTSKEVSKEVNPLAEGVEAAAITIGTGILSSHPVAAAIIAGEIVVIHALDDAIEDVDAHTASIEQTLAEQREWFQTHQGNQGDEGDEDDEDDEGDE